MIPADDLVSRLRKRAEIRRQITTRKSVQNNEPDRISDLLEEAASEIDALKEEVKKYEKHIAVRYLEELRDEPVAWMSVELDGRTVLATYEFETAIPLYTHPAKTLTDEEIVRISETCDLNHVLGLIDFARAILRKAQE